jgi:hypothetical protein
MQDAGSRHSQQPAAAAAEGSILAAGVQLGGGLTASGEYVLYRDSNTDLTLVKSAEQGVTMQLASAQSDVVTVAPVLLLSPTASSSSSSSSKVACAVVGLINMLNPGGALKSIQAGGQQQQQRARSSDGSNNGSSGNDSGSWVIAGAPAATVAAPVADTAASVSGGAAAAGAAGGSGPELMVRFTGCGLLLLYSSVQPQRFLLDGEVVGFSFDASSSRLEVVVPITGTGRDLEHVLLVCWQ